MEIKYTGTITKESTNAYINKLYPIGTKIETNEFWFKCGWMPILTSVIPSTVLTFDNITWETIVEIDI